MSSVVDSIRDSIYLLVLIVILGPGSASVALWIERLYRKRKEAADKNYRLALYALRDYWRPE